jgi:alpha-L-fucosidase
VVTAKENTLYAHILSSPGQDYIFIPSLKQKISKVTAMANGNSLKFKQQPEGVFIYLKGIENDPYDTIIKLSTN